MLPDDSIGQGPGTLSSFARHSDFGREGVKALSSALRNRLREGSRRAPREHSEQRGCKPARLNDKQLTHIVPVMGQALFFVSVPENCLGMNSLFFLG